MGILPSVFWTYKFYKAPHKKRLVVWSDFSELQLHNTNSYISRFPANRNQRYYAGWSSHSWSLGHLWMIRRPGLRKTFGIHFVRSLQNKPRTEVTDPFSGLTNEVFHSHNLGSRLKFGGKECRQIKIRPLQRIMTGLLVLIVRTGSLL